MENNQKNILVQVTVNNKTYSIQIHPEKRLVDLLRDELHLLGTKEGCGIGECGACTILFNGRAVASCTIPAGAAEGAEIVTIEGLKGDDGTLHPIQQAYIDAGAVQCGFCTPGMIMSTLALLNEYPDPTEEQIRLGLSGNLCRCTGYHQIFEAVKSAAKSMDVKKGIKL